MLARKFIRHPTDIPLEYSRPGAGSSGRQQLKNVGQGGICFRTDSNMAPGTVIHIRIPVRRPAFEADGVVVWCHRQRDHFQVGLQFDEESTRFSVRMVEQICHIEQYRKDMLEKQGRYLSGAQAAVEWIEKHAEDFPVVH